MPGRSVARRCLQRTGIDEQNAYAEQTTKQFIHDVLIIWSNNVNIILILFGEFIILCSSRSSSDDFDGTCASLIQMMTFYLALFHQAKISRIENEAIKSLLRHIQWHRPHADAILTWAQIFFNRIVKKLEDNILETGFLCFHESNHRSNSSHFDSQQKFVIFFGAKKRIRLRIYGWELPHHRYSQRPPHI